MEREIILEVTFEIIHRVYFRLLRPIDYLGDVR